MSEKECVCMVLGIKPRVSRVCKQTRHKPHILFFKKSNSVFLFCSCFWGCFVLVWFFGTGVLLTLSYIPALELYPQPPPDFLTLLFENFISEVIFVSISFLGFLFVCSSGLLLLLLLFDSLS